MELDIRWFTRPRWALVLEVLVECQNTSISSTSFVEYEVLTSFEISCDVFIFQVRGYVVSTLTVSTLIFLVSWPILTRLLDAFAANQALALTRVRLLYPRVLHKKFKESSSSPHYTSKYEARKGREGGRQGYGCSKYT